jgi:hypothetical protein
MEPNTKLLIDELAKIREEIKEGFTSHEFAIANCFTEFSVAEQLRDARISNIESAAAEFDKTFGQWKPEVDVSLSTVKLELSKLNTFFNREAKQTSASKPGVLAIKSAPDSPRGHRAEPSLRDRGYGSVYTHTHDPRNATMITPPPLPN